MERNACVLIGWSVAASLAFARGLPRFQELLRRVDRPVVHRIVQALLISGAVLGSVWTLSTGDGFRAAVAVIGSFMMLVAWAAVRHHGQGIANTAISLLVVLGGCRAPINPGYWPALALTIVQEYFAVRRVYSK